jgi:GNAT superfamily N-acetyltransferase
MSTPDAARAWLAEPHEAETVGALLVDFRDWMGRDWPSGNAILAGVERLIERSDTEFLLASPHDDAPPGGVAQLRYRFGIWHAAEDCWVEDLFVAEHARGDGVGRALVAASVERARARGCRRVELDVNERNDAALALYSSLGFEVSTKAPGGRDVLMRLALGR